MRTKLIPNSGYLNNKQIKQHLEIVKVLSKSDRSLTIAEISDAIQISLPTTKNLVSQLIDQDWAVNLGKKETDFGRKPELFGLNYDRFFTIGVLVTLKKITLVISDINLNIIHEDQLEGYKLENHQNSLNILVEFIRKNLAQKHLSINQVLGIGVGITGRVCRVKGISYNYFNFMDLPLKKYLERELGVQVEIDNDTRILGIAEKEKGTTKNLRNALVINMDLGLGMSMLLNGEIVTGQNGFAGEFGHMKFGNKNRLCLCGNRNCLGTEVSGYALVLDLQDALRNGEKSMAFKDPDGEYSYKDIIKAATQGDLLSIELIQKQGEKLGEALGNVINLLNPNKIIVAGEICKADSIFLDPLKIGIKKSVLTDFVKNETVIFSSNETNVAIGSACLILRFHDLL
jgi:predicted NBD/HSP70 family sugar kinase